MILGSKEILQRLNNGEVFRKDTWVEKSIKEASYALRVACDGLMLGGKHYRPEKDRVEGPIEIEPGKIAILSTLEQLNMPDDLVGKIGIRFDYASIGLAGLMGIQVDPLFGRDYDKERLYIRVANLGNVKISIPLCDEVFTLELHQVTGGVQQASRARVPIWHRIQENLAGQPDPSWSYVTRVQSELSEKAANLDERLESETKNIRDYLQPVVMFGIFLLAVTILGVVLAVILNVREVATVTVPSWVSTGGWVLLLLTLSIAAISTAAMGFLMIRRLFGEE